MWENLTFCPLRESVDRRSVKSVKMLRVSQRTLGDISSLIRSVAKSMAVSEDWIRGQPLGESAAAKLVWANIRRSAGEWKDRMLVWTRNNVFPHNTSTFPSSR